MTSIGNYAFRNCSAMTNVVFMGNAPTVGTDGFSGVASGCVASVSPKSTGWCVEAGETWNGLILQYLPFTYEDWAEENSITGAWNETSGGIYNVFRYVFGQPTGDFPLITGIDVGESEVVITTSAVVNSDGVTVSVVESSDLAGETVTDTKALEALEAEGRAEFTKDPAAEFRFYRLKAEVTE